MDRFISEQKKDYDTALKEIKYGKKMSHWIWYIFPQITGLGQSFMCKKYDIKNIEESKEYLNNNVLRSHLIEICNALLKHAGKKNIFEIMSYDNVKLLSCMTLFKKADEKENKCKGIFQNVIEAFYDGNEDKQTLKILEEQKMQKKKNKSITKKEINDNNNNDKSQINCGHNINTKNKIINDVGILDKEKNRLNNNQNNIINKEKMKNKGNSNDISNNNDHHHQMDIINNSPQNSYTNINSQQTRFVTKKDNINDINSKNSLEKMDIEFHTNVYDVKKINEIKSYPRDSDEEMEIEKTSSIIDEKLGWSSMKNNKGVKSKSIVGKKYPSNIIKIEKKENKGLKKTIYKSIGPFLENKKKNNDDSKSNHKYHESKYLKSGTINNTNNLGKINDIEKKKNINKKNPSTQFHDKKITDYFKKDK